MHCPDSRDDKQGAVEAEPSSSRFFVPAKHVAHKKGVRRRVERLEPRRMSKYREVNNTVVHIVSLEKTHVREGKRA